MATGTWESGAASDADAVLVAQRKVGRVGSMAAFVLRGLASLKITVALFAMGIFIILVGTLAQVDKDMWDVIDLYFRSWFARIELQIFLPRSWFPQLQNVDGAFWFPGGALIGAAMVVNLIAAHTIRFQAQARGRRLFSGVVLLAAGTAMTAYIIVSGHNHAGLQGEPPFTWQTLWILVKSGLVLACAASIYFAMSRPADRDKGMERNLGWLAAVCTGGVSVWLIASESAYLGDSGMRILWQLIQSTICGLVLLAGCALVFGKRAGIVLIHAGIGLMMFGQFFVSKYDVEEQMRIDEGQTRTFAEDMRQVELAIIDSSQPAEDRVVVVPRSILLASMSPSGYSWPVGRPPEVDEKGVIRHPDLPFDVQVLEYHRNADVREIKPEDSNPATAGFGKQFLAVPVKPAAGADSGGRVDLAAAYVKLTHQDGSALGTFLLSQLASFQDLTDSVEVDGRKYALSLRFRRNYKPYQITLKDVRKDDYVGTSTPRNYSSDIHLVDGSRGVDREIHIWMNNPLRYAGETFYQSGYAGPPDSRIETTTISVVTNAGWMIPYVSCMIVFVGLVAHFGGTLIRYLRRRERAVMRGEGSEPRAIEVAVASRRRDDKGRRKEVDLEKAAKAASPIGDRLRRAAFPALMVAPFVVMLLRSLISAPPPPDQFDLRAFGRLPVVDNGRVKPFDTLARTTMRALSNKEAFRDDENRSQPAIRWLLDVIAQTADAEKHRVIRIDNLEVLDLLGLKRRKGSLYSVEELRRNAEAFERQVQTAQNESRQNGPETLTVFQKKLIELDGRVRTYTRVAAAFQPPPLPPLPTQEEFVSDRAAADQKLAQFRDEFLMFRRSIDGIHPPLAVPADSAPDHGNRKDAPWEPYSKAWALAYIGTKVMGESPPPAVRELNVIFASYADGEVGQFNRAVADYHGLLARLRPADLQADNTFSNRFVTRVFGNFYGFEEYFNHVAPFFFCWFPYIFAGVLAAASWLGASQPLRRAAYWLLVFAFVVHTVALGARIYISGRPPVTNLYSSAVFIGWAIVLFCLVWEQLSRDGIASFLASALGFATLLIAHILAGDGDTFTVLQAVLDTQFWLGTHVVTITLGYAATLLAGGLGIIYVVRGVFTPTLDREASQNLARMIYGTTCFGLLFSFIGTVLGGLWADDSWGRFWGWDPKENGALIIVLWNALVLHARWDGMIKDRGLAVLAVGGNIVTSWSWFGVNELGVGLHSYGFTEGVLLTLVLFLASQAGVIIGGCLPKTLWVSGGSSSTPTTTSRCAAGR